MRRLLTTILIAGLIGALIGYAIRLQQLWNEYHTQQYHDYINDR